MLDSLQKVFNSNAHDTTRCYALAEKARIYIRLDDSIQLNKAINSVADMYFEKKEPYFGNWYFVLLAMKEEKYGQSSELQLDYMLKSAECCEKAKIGSLLARRLQRVGHLELRLGRFNEAVTHIFQALKLNEKAKNQIGASYNYFALGEIFRIQENYPKALQMYREGYSLAKKIDDYAGINSGCANLGILHQHNRELDSSLYYYSKGLDLAIKNKKSGDIADGYERLSGIYMLKGKFELGLEMELKAFAMKEKLGDLSDITVANIKLAEIYKDLKRYAESEKHVSTAIDLSEKLKDPTYIEQSYKLQGFIYRQEGKFEASLTSFLTYMSIHDSLITSSNNAHNADLESKYHNEKKEKEIQLLNKDKLISEADIKKQKQFSYFIIAIAVSLAFTVFFIFRGLRQKHRDNKILQDKNRIIEKQKELVEEKQKEILDSIYYARRIQRAQIPSEKQIAKSLDRLRK